MTRPASTCAAWASVMPAGRAGNEGLGLENEREHERACEPRPVELPEDDVRGAELATVDVRGDRDVGGDREERLPAVARDLERLLRVGQSVVEVASPQVRGRTAVRDRGERGGQTAIARVVERPGRLADRRFEILRPRRTTERGGQDGAVPDAVGHQTPVGERAPGRRADLASRCKRIGTGHGERRTEPPLARSVVLRGTGEHALDALGRRGRELGVEHRHGRVPGLEPTPVALVAGDGDRLVVRGRGLRRVADRELRVAEVLEQGGPLSVGGGVSRVPTVEEREGLEQRVGAVRPAACGPRAAERAEEAHAFGGRGRLGQRAFERRDRGLGRTVQHGLTRGRAEGLHDPGIAVARGAKQMRGDPREARSLRVQAASGGEMRAAASGGRNGARDRLAGEGMDEPQRIAGDEHTDVDEPVDGRRGGLSRQSRERRDVAQERVLVEHGHGVGEGLRRSGVPGAPDVVEDQLRHGAGRDVERLGIRRQVREHLAQEEWVAAGRANARGDERVRRLAAGRRHEGRDPRLRERRQLHPRRARDLADRAGGVGRGGAHRSEQSDGRVGEARGEVAQRAQRGRVGPVEVVHEQDERSLGREVLHDPPDAVVDRLGLVGSGRRRAAEQQPAGELRRAVEQARAALAVRIDDLAFAELEHYAVGDGPLVFTADRPQDAHAPRCGLLRRPGEQGALAEAGRRIEDDGAARAGPHRVERAGEVLLRGLSLQEGRHGSGIPADRRGAVPNPGEPSLVTRGADRSNTHAAPTHRLGDPG